MAGKLAMYVAFSAAVALASSPLALAFNPQPDPPGKNKITNPATNHMEPPDPCIQSHSSSMMMTQSHGSGGGAGKAKMGAMSSKNSAMMSDRHCLNPQPLPPG